MTPKERAIEHFKAYTNPNGDVFEILEGVRKRALEAIDIASEPFDATDMYAMAFKRTLQSSLDGLIGAGIKECLETLVLGGIITFKEPYQIINSKEGIIKLTE